MAKLKSGKYFKQLSDNYQISKQFTKDIPDYTLWEKSGKQWQAILYGSHAECMKLYREKTAND
jgi:hypothetical protein